VTKISSIQGCGLWNVQSCKFYVTLTVHNLHDFLKKHKVLVTAFYTFIGRSVSKFWG